MAVLPLTPTWWDGGQWGFSNRHSSRRRRVCYTCERAPPPSPPSPPPTPAHPRANDRSEGPRTPGIHPHSATLKVAQHLNLPTLPEFRRRIKNQLWNIIYAADPCSVELRSFLRLFHRTDLNFPSRIYIFHPTDFNFPS